MNDQDTHHLGSYRRTPWIAIVSDVIPADIGSGMYLQRVPGSRELSRRHLGSATGLVAIVECDG